MNDSIRTTYRRWAPLFNEDQFRSALAEILLKHTASLHRPISIQSGGAGGHGVVGAYDAAWNDALEAVARLVKE